MKGKTKITLTHAVTGEKVTYEDNNLITDNFLNIINFKSYMGQLGIYSRNAYVNYITELFGSIGIFDGVIDEASKTLPNTVRPVGYGEYAYIPTAALECVGAYNNTESVFNADNVTLVWDFPTNCANGSIKAVCLMPKYAGRTCIYGAPKASSYYSEQSYYEILGPTVVESAPDPISMLDSKYVLDYDIDNYEELSISYISNKSVTFTRKKYRKDQLRMVGDNVRYDILEVKICTSNPSYYIYFVGYDRITKMAYFSSVNTLAVGASTTLYYFEFGDTTDLSTITESNVVVTNNTSKVFYFSNFTDANDASMVYNGEIFCYARHSTTLQAIKISDNTSREIGTPDGSTIWSTSSTTAQNIQLIERNGLIFLGQNITTFLSRVYNPVLNEGYTNFSKKTSLRTLVRDAVSSYGTIFTGALMTINNLETPVVKTSDYTMQIAYTLSEL